MLVCAVGCRMWVGGCWFVWWDVKCAWIDVGLCGPTQHCDTRLGGTQAATQTGGAGPYTGMFWLGVQWVLDAGEAVPRGGPAHLSPLSLQRGLFGCASHHACAAPC
eukprot:1978854-Rhodomonas_salina.1